MRLYTQLILRKNLALCASRSGIALTASRLYTYYMIETHRRTLARAISYRIVATLITAAFTGFGTAILIHVLLTLVHYVMERLWLKVPWGLIQK